MVVDGGGLAYFIYNYCDLFHWVAELSDAVPFPTTPLLSPSGGRRSRGALGADAQDADRDVPELPSRMREPHADVAGPGVAGHLIVVEGRGGASGVWAPVVGGGEFQIAGGVNQCWIVVQ